MIETENNGPVWFHSSAERPTFPEIQKYIAEQEWG
jgi:hypothetical protein